VAAGDTLAADIVRDLVEDLMNQDADGNLILGVATGYTTNEERNVFTFICLVI